MKTNGLAAQHYLLEVALRREKIASFAAYPFNLPAVRHLASQSLILHPKATFLVGENGSGKSTLLEAIAIAWGFNPEGGTRNFSFSTRDSHSDLHAALRMSKGIHRPKDGFFLRAESFFNVGTEIERLDREPGGPPIIGAYGGRYLHDMSHGESFFALLHNRFFGHGLYILDEPEAALSPTRQLAMLARFHELAGQHSQFVIATHSPILMAYPDADIYQIDERGLTRTAYEDTEHYIVAKAFLNDTKRQLARICA
ncbi:MAG: AAA family ATPase [Candidatus Accumulibacter sp.]|nr:AAA family ATPase [Accumulibacter sp.]